MTEPPKDKTRFTGVVENFHMVEDLDGQAGSRYFEFALLELPFPQDPGIPPAHTVFYVDPRRDFAAACSGAVVVAWSRQQMVDVYLDIHDPANMRVCSVVPWVPLAAAQ